MARTVTGTATFARFSLLEMQVRSLLRNTAGADDDVLRRVSLGLEQPHYIETVIVHGLYGNGNIGAELKLSIDWREHAIAIAAGGANVQVPTTWGGGDAPSLVEAVRTFNKAVEKASLSIEWKVRYGAHWDVDTVNQKLGFRRASLRSWEREPERVELGFDPLTEASLVISLAI